MVNVDCEITPPASTFNMTLFGSKVYATSGLDDFRDICVATYPSDITTLSEKVFFTEMLRDVWAEVVNIVNTPTYPNRADILDSLFVDPNNLSSDNVSSAEMSDGFFEVVNDYRRACHYQIKINMLDDYGNIENTIDEVTNGLS